jgi:hypothetical protein
VRDVCGATDAHPVSDVEGHSSVTTVVVLLVVGLGLLQTVPDVLKLEGLLLLRHRLGHRRDPGFARLII